MSDWQSNAFVLIGIPACVSVVVIGLLIVASRVVQLRRRRRRLASSSAVEAVLTATAAVDAAGVSLKKMLEAVPGTSEALTGRSATTAIETTTRAVLEILADLPVRLQNVELAIRQLELGLKEMRELFNRLGK